jgi:hypothetical protein
LAEGMSMPLNAAEPVLTIGAAALLRPLSRPVCWRRKPGWTVPVAPPRGAGIKNYPV